MKFEVLDVDEGQIRFMDSLMLDGRKRLYPLTAYFYQKHVTYAQLRAWCHTRARYSIVTRELLDWLLCKISGKKAIEIGAGMGDLGYNLGIPMTDSYQQTTDQTTAIAMQAFNQPPTTPPLDVMMMDAQTAVLKFKPQIVIGSWITQRWLPGDEEGNMYGPREEQIIKNCQTYIFIGNEKVHGGKRILKLPHKTFKIPGLVSRASEPDKNVIWVWGDL